MKTVAWFLIGYLFIPALPVMGNCPSMDATGDCFVDLADLAVLAGQWLTGHKPPADMIYIQGGTFQMGDNRGEAYSDELPVHTVLLNPFYIGKTEITNRQYSQYLNSAIRSRTIYVLGGMVYGSGNNQVYCDTSASSPYSMIAYERSFSLLSKRDRRMDNDPVVMVSWYGAAAYCNWQSEQEGRQPCYNLSSWECDFTRDGYHLPTEAQWEYAARGGLVGIRFPWGNIIAHIQANFYNNALLPYEGGPTYGYHPDWNDSIEPYTCPVESFAANGFGLYGMTGNVFEWCNDWYRNNYYSLSPYYNPTGPGMETHRIVRGGSWSSSADQCRVSYRGHTSPDDRYYGNGFRISMDYK
jgi:sulfatase modifying factor 1